MPSSRQLYFGLNREIRRANVLCPLIRMQIRPVPRGDHQPNSMWLVPRVIINMELVVHYRPNQDCSELSEIAERLLEDFPQRTLPRFTPWFPNNLRSLPLKPQKSPPIISKEEAKKIEKHLVEREFKAEAQNYDCTDSLLEFSTNLQRESPVIQVAAVEFLSEIGSRCGITTNECKSERSWSIATHSRQRRNNTSTVSQRFQIIKEKFQLHSFQRAKWVIDQSNCSSWKLEEVWAKLSSVIKYGDLPGCNAKIHAHLGQIWIFCDLLCCEYVGNLIKQVLNLTGKISLLVRGHGIIYKL
ncbi:shieldin complex subunit 3 [Pristis pectinata]|uniref:shieldin complex subunit 3 n=1 Tax=Pristis pectinata TaxID=685728 RepID=UPI00223E82B7|nr:shieldin complex subunit 3 [Pristis pectinata]